MVAKLKAVEARAQDSDFVTQCSFQGLQEQLPLCWPTPPDIPPSPKSRYRSLYVYLSWEDLSDPATWEQLSLPYTSFEATSLESFSACRRVISSGFCLGDHKSLPLAGSG